MWKWLAKSRTIKNDLLNFKDEPLTGLSIVLLIILDLFIFFNVMIGVRGETAKAPYVSQHFPYDCIKHFEKAQVDYASYHNYRYGQSREAHLRPHLSQYCKNLDAKIEVFSLKKPFKNNLKLIKKIKSKIRLNDNRLKQISKSYNTRLFERIAQMQNNIELRNAKSEYDSIILDNITLKEELTLIPKVSSLDGFEAYSKYIEKTKSAFIKDKKSYKFWQPFKAYAHMLVFILPLLVFFGFWYGRAKKRQLLQKEYNPVIKIISAHISLILVLPLFWYSITLIYHVLPKTLLKSLIEFLVDIGLISLLNYFAILLVVLIFGALIYWIQKRTLAKKKNAKIIKNFSRIVSLSQCHDCGLKVDYARPFCPFCGTGLHEECSSCKAKMNKYESFCSKCGKKH
ncbi:MAG: hypothetical protein COA44_10345 [Arcobacter sp.]|nr:MAG: hypothetical protein COA44_10345 [Arcobacter sp.]